MVDFEIESLTSGNGLKFSYCTSCRSSIITGEYNTQRVYKYSNKAIVDAHPRRQLSSIISKNIIETEQINSYISSSKNRKEKLFCFEFPLCFFKFQLFVCLYSKFFVYTHTHTSKASYKTIQTRGREKKRGEKKRK